MTLSKSTLKVSVISTGETARKMIILAKRVLDFEFVGTKKVERCDENISCWWKWGDDDLKIFLFTAVLISRFPSSADNCYQHWEWDQSCLLKCLRRFEETVLNCKYFTLTLCWARLAIDSRMQLSKQSSLLFRKWKSFHWEKEKFRHSNRFKLWM